MISTSSTLSLNNAELNLLEQYRRMEEDALDNISKLVKKVKNKNVKILLKDLEDDEKLHRKALDSLIALLQSNRECGFWDVLKGYLTKP